MVLFKSTNLNRATLIADFTFQYGSIQIYDELLKPYGLQALHSNMVLFKLKMLLGIRVLPALYIPIWFYSNPFWIIFN